jgi:uncharacterized protein YdaU (DUF1376 family)
MPFNIADYHADTRHLSTVQHGAYMLLILHYWARGDLPDDDQQLANITGLSMEEWLANRAVINRFFFDGWKHKRIEHELKRRAEIYLKKRAAAEKSNFKREMNKFRRL